MAAGLVGALIVYLIVAAAASIAPFEKKATVAAPPSSSTSSSSASTTPGSIAPEADPTAFLESIHTQSHFDGLSDSDLTTLGNDMCQDFAAGNTLDQTKQDALKAIDEINANDAESGNNPGGSLTPYDAGYLVGAAVRNLCPEYLSQINP